jgi:tetratricopeptide (TPR) repeat protein
LLAAWQLTLERETPLHRALVRAAPVWLGAACAALVILALSRHRELVAFSLDQRSPLEALRGNLFALPEILRLWVEPWRISVLPRQPVIYGWGDGPTLLRLAALAALPLVAWAVRRRAPLVALAILWTLLALAPTNSLIWRMDPVALRPLYLAGIGLSLLVALLLMQLRPGPAMALALAAWLASETWQRATLYQDEVALFADAAAKTPDEPRAQLMLGLVLANAGRFDEARAALTRALTLDPYLEAATRALRLIDAGRDVYATDP